MIGEFGLYALVPGYIAIINGLNLDECLVQAWHEIKGRKGHMNEQGVLIKETES